VRLVVVAKVTADEPVKPAVKVKASTAPAPAVPVQRDPREETGDDRNPGAIETPVRARRAKVVKSAEGAP
jgi:hypothetical protein